MSKYIKLEDAINEAKAWSMYGKDDLVSRLGRLPDMVHCSECKYDHICAHEVVHRTTTGWEYCPIDYCSAGRRKEQEE